jgi:hypothetical protein
VIRVVRGPEPRGLRVARKRRFAKAHADYVAGGSVSAHLHGYGTPTTRRTLWQAQHEKCAYCEVHIRQSSSHVEHHRPKDGAWRHKRGTPRVVDSERYWWLTWSWENLLLSCARCNDQGHKANFFPLDPGTSPLPVPPKTPLPPVPQPLPMSIWSTSSEHPLLLDPASPTVDPLDHIEWEPTFPHLARKQWKWAPTFRTPFGERTIDVLQLLDLADEVDDYLNRHVLPRVDSVDGHVVSNRLPLARQEWTKLVNDLVDDPKAQYRAATWCALDRWMPSASRTHYGLAQLTRP